jgi:hypothetical protein
MRSWTGDMEIGLHQTSLEMCKKLASSGLKPKAQPLLPDNFPTASRHVLKEKQIGHKGSTLWGY